MSSLLFYKNLPVIPSFEEVIDPSNHHELPEDWFIIVTDVVESTSAIQMGRYKDVNALGGSIVVSILNINREIPIPFVFGGDGATLAIPGEFRKQAIAALVATEILAQEGFDLELRIGMIAVKELREKDVTCGVAKWRLSSSVLQAAFSGSGWEKAEQLIKNSDTRKKYEVTLADGAEPYADYTGFECRWQRVPSRNGHQLALLALCPSEDPRVRAQVYGDIIKRMESIYGHLSNFHPLTAERMKLASSPGAFTQEAKIKVGGLLGWLGFWRCLKLWLLNFVGMFLIWKGEKKKNTNWGTYRQELVDNADFRKFDGVLKMIIDGNNQQGLELARYLQSLRSKNLLYFGLHKSRSAMVTCIVFSHHQHHMHFVDGSDGGYAMAASMLKEQMRKS